MNAGLPNGETLSNGGRELERLADFGAGDISSLAHGLRNQECESEKRLYMAVLEEAVCQYRDAIKNLCLGRQGKKYGGVTYLYRGVVWQLEAWFDSDDTKWPCSFGNICNILGYDIGYFRKRLRRIKESAERSIPGLDVT